MYKDKSAIESPKSMFCQYYSSKVVNYTLVLHPIGRHHDIFADGQPSLENRVCLCVDNIRSSLKATKYGRGGCGTNTFVLPYWIGIHII